jgi:hypothetical protein
MISIGRKFFELGKWVFYATKNAELDAKILQLSGSESLRSIIVENGSVAMSGKNTVKISGARANLYSVARGADSFANEFAPNKISKQTNLTIRNQ